MNFQVKPRMSLGEVIVDVLADGDSIGTARCAIEQSAYSGLHAVAPALSEIIKSAYLAGVRDGGVPPTQPSEPPPPSRPAKAKRAA